MPLDLVQAAPQIGVLVAKLKAGAGERDKRLRCALELLQSQAVETEELNRKITSSKTTWLVAGLHEEPNRRYRDPRPPSEFTILAVDGSHIDVDRHNSVACYLINIGSALLCYGENASAWLSSTPILYFEEELFLVDPLSGLREEPIERALLGVKRSVEECRYLGRLAKELRQDIPALMLLDGSLILWGLAGQAFPEFVKEAFLEKGLLTSLEELRRLSQGRNFALASYISFPRSTEVTNALRLILCPYEPADCDRYCSGKHSPAKRECEPLAGIQDRELFDQLLEPGERSSLFLSRSSIVRNHYGEHQILFFYLKVDEEIARVEIPLWVAQDNDLLQLVHATVLDQCRRGQGYPVALSEAHEKAVVTAADREQFWRLVECNLMENQLPARNSAKSQSKRTRWV